MEIIRNLIHSDLSSIKDFRDGVIGSLEARGIDEDLIFKIRLVLDELIINSYKHGNNKIYEKMIDVIMMIDNDYCMIKVKDEGEGIDYYNKSDLLSNHGRGIQLVYSLSDNLIVKDNIIVALLLNNQSQSFV